MLSERRVPVRDLVRLLTNEDVLRVGENRLKAFALIDALAAVGVPDADRRKGFAGVWCRGKKVASVGVAVTADWITWHGIAVNVCPDLSYFGRINPCGLDAHVMTSVAALGGNDDPAATKDALVAGLPTIISELRR